MASAAEQLAANINFGAFTKATELKKRIWFTLGALIIYRLGTYIPLPGIDPQVLAEIFQQQCRRHPRHVRHVLGRRARAHDDLRAQHHALHLGLDHHAADDRGLADPRSQLKKEGEAGARSSTSTRAIGTVFLAAVQAYGIAVGLEGMRAPAGRAVIDPGLFFRLTTVVTLTGGTVFLMWLGEQITARGVGNGISLIIFIGIVANLPQRSGPAPSSSAAPARSRPLFIILFLVMAVGRHRLHRLHGARPAAASSCSIRSARWATRCSAARASHLPLKLNTSGVIPPIFASSLLLLPATIAGFTAGIGRAGWLAADHRLSRPRPAALHGRSMSR